MVIGCVICTEEFHTSCDNGQVIGIKKCGHVFHDACLKMWLKKSRTCPICRTVTFDSTEYIGRLHLQRLSLDNPNPTVNNLLDETIELKKKLEEKDDKLKKMDDELKKMTTRRARDGN